MKRGNCQAAVTDYAIAESAVADSAVRRQLTLFDGNTANAFLLDSC